MATLAITRAIRTTASNILEVHANLTPAELPLQKICHWATLRLVSIPESHPLHKLVKHSANHFMKPHGSPLHNLMHACKILPSKLETSNLVGQAPNKCASSIHTLPTRGKSQGSRMRQTGCPSVFRWLRTQRSGRGRGSPVMRFTTSESTLLSPRAIYMPHNL